MNEYFKKLYWIFSIQLGVDFRRLFNSIRGLPRFIRDLILFRKLYTGKLDLRPCLHDWYEEGGSAKGEYFWQDLHVARKINQVNPRKHVDIGSRIDGFVSHVACFREIEIIDIRPLFSKIEGVVFKQADLMSPQTGLNEYCDSLSCLHALEHFGLGRYGDSIDPMGYYHGLKNMSQLLQCGGIFYLSVPIGVERVEFNAHRVFDPLKLVSMAIDFGLILQELTWFDSRMGLVHSIDPHIDLRRLGTLKYTLGIFIFRKN
jgi:hypothetical protein